MTQKLTFVNGAKAACGCRHEFSSGGGEYSDVASVHLCAMHAGTPVLDDRWKARMLDGRAPERDEMGLGDHPELPMLDEGMTPRSFFAALGLELAHTSAEDQLDWDVLGAMSEAVNWADWLPTPPQGDGWKLVSIFDTEDGPVAWWLRELPEAEDGTTTIRILQAEVEKLKARIARAGAAPAAVDGSSDERAAVLDAARDLIELRDEYAQKTQNAMPGNEYWSERFDAKYQALAAALAAAPALEAPAAPAQDNELIERVRQAYKLVNAHAFDLPGGDAHKNMWLEQAESLGSVIDQLRLAAAPQAPAAPSALATQVIENLLQMARIVNTTVEDWGETKEDDTLHVIFHKEQADKLEEILDFLDSLPDAPPEEGVILSGPSRAARIAAQAKEGGA